MSDLPSPVAPKFKSDEEINRITPDPKLPPFGGGFNPLFTQITTPAPLKVALGGFRPQRGIGRITYWR